MAERRMFAKTIIDSDAFLDMPVTARLLYYDLGMRADDDGFVNSYKKIMRMIGASADDMNILIAKKFVIPFESGVVVIKHWRINNYLRKDRYNETNYKDEKAMLSVDDIGNYHLINDVGIPGGIPLVDTGKDSIGKDSIGKDIKEKEIDKSISKKKSPERLTIPPTVEMVKAYCEERKNGIDAQHFIDFYESRGWMIGKVKMKDWQAAVRTWEGKRKQETKNDDWWKNA